MTHSPSSAQSEKVAPCPFCGCKIVGLGYIGQPAREIYAICYQCKATGPSQEYQTGMMFDFDATWNRRAAASAHTIGEDAANVAIGEREAYLARFGTENESLAFAMRAIAADAYDTGYATARAAVSAEKVAGQEPYGYAPVHPNGNYFTRNKSTADYVGGLMPVYAAPQQPAQPVAQTPALTDEQREAIEYAVRWMDENVSNRYAHTATKELRALLAAQPASSLAEGGK